MKDFSDRFNAFLKAIGKSVADVAKETGTSNSKYYHFKNGLRESPKYESIAKLVQVYNVNPDWLLAGNGEMFLSDKNNQVSEPEPVYNKPVKETEDIRALVGRFLDIIEQKNEMLEKKEDKNTRLETEIISITRDLKDENKDLRVRMDRREEKIDRMTEILVGLFSEIKERLVFADQEGKKKEAV